MREGHHFESQTNYLIQGMAPIPMTVITVTSPTPVGIAQPGKKPNSSDSAVKSHSE